MFHSGAKSDLCSKTGLYCASHLCVRQRGVSAYPVCYPQVQPVSWGSTPPSSQAEVRGQNASGFPCRELLCPGPPDSVCATIKFAFCTPASLFSLGPGTTGLPDVSVVFLWLSEKTKVQDESFEKGLPRWRNSEELPANAGGTRDTGSIPGSGRSPGGGTGNPLHYSCLGNPMDREPWQAMVHGVTRVRHDCQVLVSLGLGTLNN